MKKLCALLTVSFLFFGCATSKEYNPLVSSQQQTFILNQSSFTRITVGMKQQKVHEIMGDEIIIGYDYDQDNQNHPLTIANPYKKEETSEYTVEYYVTRINQPDGVVTDDELVPLVFKEGVLVGQGWEYLKSLHLK